LANLSNVSIHLDVSAAESKVIIQTSKSSTVLSSNEACWRLIYFKTVHYS